MEMALSEISLVVFTAIAPAGAAGYAAMALVARLARNEGAGERSDRFLVIPLSLTLIGLIASATHLGTPANALYVIAGLGRSPLSNEVASAAAFLALGGAYWILSFPYRQRIAFKTVLLVASLFAAASFVYFVSQAYAVESIVTWNNPVAPFTQWACAIAAGSLVALAGLHVARFPVSRKLATALIVVSLSAVVLCIALLAVERQIVSGMHTVTVNAGDMAPFLAVQIGAFAVLAAVGIVCAHVGERRIEAFAEERGDKRASSDSDKSRRLSEPTPFIVSAFLLLAACFVVRFAFYAMYMTAGI